MAEELKASTDNCQQVESDKTPTPQTQLDKISRMLDRPHESRTASQLHLLHTWIKQNPALSKLSQQISYQFVKSLFRAATIVSVPKDSVVYMLGERVGEMGVVIAGQLAVLARGEQADGRTGDVGANDIFDRLLENAKVLARDLKKKQSSVVALENSQRRAQLGPFHKTFTPISAVSAEPIPPSAIQCCINQNEYIGFRDRSMGQTFVQTCICQNSDTILLLFKQSNIMACLEVALKQKIKKVASILKGIPCFNFLDVERVNSIIQSMSLRKRRKLEHVYSQGQPSTSFYLLVEGEVKITKETNLFEQNPNHLYGDRKKLIEESLTEHRKQVDKVQKLFIDKKVRKSMLPYANLTSMYNYRPMKKMIEIGVVTPPSLFGEEEYFEKKRRDTNAICYSLNTEYYEINIGKIEEIVGAKLLPIFEKQLRGLVRKKVLYRQSQYANSIHLENDQNLNYFYLEDGKQKQSPRKFKISKFNNIIQPKKTSPESQQKQQQQEQSPATYTTFNFNRMKNNLHKSERRAKKNDYDCEDEQQYEKDPAQLKIMNITHTWKLMKQKVDMEIRASQKISPFKPTINLKKPLIGSEYFYHVEKESRRIEREHRKRIASLSRSYRISRVTDKTASNLNI